MKQAWKWLTIVSPHRAAIVAALLLVPHAALAQGGRKPAKPAAAAPAPAAGGEIELDTPPPAAPAPGATPAPGADQAGGAATGGLTGGICDIDPSACPKTSPEDLKKQASKGVAAEVYAVQQIYALRYHRLEIKPYWGVSLNDQFVSHPGPGLDLNFYITNVLAIGLNGNLYAGLNGDSDFNFEVRRSARLAVPLTEYREGANFNFTYVPVYGKFSGFRKFIFHYDAYLVGGVGEIDTRPIAVIDPDNRTFEFKPKIDFDIGIGLRIFFNRWFAVNLEVRDYIYDEQLENLCIAGQAPSSTCSAAQVKGSPTDPSTWYGNSSITQDFQAQAGISVFLPFSWEYRLPK